jgi:hypothetical protein
MNQKCSTCAFFHGENEMGACRRHPPQIDIAYQVRINKRYGGEDDDISDLLDGVWPRVHSESWCGEWKVAHE